MAFCEDAWSNQITEFYKISKRTYRARLMYNVLSEFYKIYNHPQQCLSSLYDKVLPIIKLAETQDYIVFEDFKNIYPSEYDDFNKPIVSAARTFCSTEIGSVSFYNTIHDVGILRGQPEKERQMILMQKLINQMKINHELVK